MLGLRHKHAILRRPPTISIELAGSRASRAPPHPRAQQQLSTHQASDMIFKDRRHAGQALGVEVVRALGSVQPSPPAVVLALPRGGVPVADEVARALGHNAPLDVMIVRKIGAPAHPEYAIGAMAEVSSSVSAEPVFVLDQRAAQAIGASRAEVEQVVHRERKELARRQRAYRGGRARERVAGRTAVVVDDGLATGSTARAALTALRREGAARLVLAVPVGSPDSVAELRRSGLADDVVCVSTPPSFHAVGQFYLDFGQTSDAEVLAVLRRYHPPGGDEPPPPLLAHAAPAGAHDEPPPQQQRRPVPVEAGGPARSPPPRQRAAAAAAAPPAPLEPCSDVAVVVRDEEGELQLPGLLTVPAGATGIVLFAHGSGSGRFSPRNAAVAATLNDAGTATLLFDLLSEREAADRANVFDIPLLASRLVAAARWLRRERGVPDAFPLGLFGASTGGGAALWAAAQLGGRVAGVVSRGGRPDLAGPMLGRVSCPVLLIAGGYDFDVLELNRRAAQELADCEVEVVPGATHLFEEHGALEAVAARAAGWLRDRFAAAARRGAAA